VRNERIARRTTTLQHGGLLQTIGGICFTNNKITVDLRSEMPNESPLNTLHTLADVDLSKVEQFAKSKRTSILVIFFDDMQASTALKQKITSELDEEAFQDIRREHDQVVTTAVTRENAGQIIKSTGDGILAVFSEPSTAVERAIEIQLQLYGNQHIKVRIGLDMGQVRVEKAGGVQSDLFGRHVDWAARAMSMAEPGHILVTRSVYIDAFGWIPKSLVAWKEHGFFSKKEAEEALELFEPYDPQSTSAMTTLTATHFSQPTTTTGDLTAVMITGTACLCLIILTLGAVIAVVQGGIPSSTLSTTSSLSIGGGLLGLATLFYKLLTISSPRKIAR
jgi:class 3 adenylate cyclase